MVTSHLTAMKIWQQYDLVTVAKKGVTKHQPALNTIMRQTFFYLSQGVLTQVTSSTKQTLNRLGVFTVSSFHAFVCARSPSLLNNLLAGRGATKRRAPTLARSNSASSRRSLSVGGVGVVGGGTMGVAAATVVSPASGGEGGSESKLVKVTLPDGEVSHFWLSY